MGRCSWSYSSCRVMGLEETKRERDLILHIVTSQVSTYWHPYLFVLNAQMLHLSWVHSGCRLTPLTVLLGAGSWLDYNQGSLSPTTFSGVHCTPRTLNHSLLANQARVCPLLLSFFILLFCSFPSLPLMR